MGSDLLSLQVSKVFCLEMFDSHLAFQGSDSDSYTFRARYNLGCLPLFRRGCWYPLFKAFQVRRFA